MSRAAEEVYAAIRRQGTQKSVVGRMQTRAELYATIGYHDYEALDASIVTTAPVVTAAMGGTSDVILFYPT